VSNYDSLFLLFIRFDNHDPQSCGFLPDHGSEFSQQEGSGSDRLSQSQRNQLYRSFALAFLLSWGAAELMVRRFRLFEITAGAQLAKDVDGA
jgi:hypothetical protein